jgi:hypothetical protein
MRRSWAIVAALGLVLASCGGEQEPDRFDLRTPGAKTGQPPPVATPEAHPVTSAEKRVLKGWADSLRRGSVKSAAAYFALPAEITPASGPSARLTRRAEVREFNRGLPCGLTLLETRRGPLSFVLGTFRLSERKTKGGASCGTDIGRIVTVAFQIKDEHITRWMRDVAALGAAPAATPTPTPSSG